MRVLFDRSRYALVVFVSPTCTELGTQQRASFYSIMGKNLWYYSSPSNLTIRTFIFSNSTLSLWQTGVIGQTEVPLSIASKNSLIKVRPSLEWKLASLLQLHRMVFQQSTKGSWENQRGTIPVCDSGQRFLVSDEENVIKPFIPVPTHSTEMIMEIPASPGLEDPEVQKSHRPIK